MKRDLLNYLNIYLSENDVINLKSVPKSFKYKIKIY